jgi:two-component system, cell cycle sensor histidine kinase and response regulator CckA
MGGGATRTARLAVGTPRTDALLHAIREPVLVVEDGRIRFANPALCELLDRAADEVVGTEPETLVHGDDRRRFSLAVSDVSGGTRPTARVEIGLPSVGGEKRIVEVELLAARREDSPAVLCFLRERGGTLRGRSMHGRLLYAQKMEGLGQLAGGVAHDVNNVLGAIMGFASVLHAEIEPSDPRRADLEQILAACRKGRDLTLNLLGFAREGKYRVERFSLVDGAESAVDLLRHTISKKITISTSLDPGAPPVRGDPSQIKHAVMNLCLNSVDAIGEAGTISLSADRYLVAEDDPDWSHLPAGQYCRLRVGDDGIGMTDPVRERVFEPFFTTKEAGEGSGLGLPMVYGTVRNHGGDVRLTSSPGAGTTVTVLLPAADVESGAPGHDGVQRRPSDPRRGTVLMVDDERIVRRAGRRLLEKLGYRVLMAEDGREGLRRFVESRSEIAAVILDLIMPVMDGAEMFRKIREIDPEVRVILASGYSREEMADNLLAEGADGFLQKPFDLEALREQLAGLAD